jgi:hypothetical protein
MVNDTPHNSIHFQLPKLLDQHLLGNRRDRFFEVREAKDISPKEMKED